MINTDQLLSMTVIAVGRFMDLVNTALNEPTEMMVRCPMVSVDELMATVSEHALVARSDDPTHWETDMFPDWTMGLYYETRGYVDEKQTYDAFKTTLMTPDIMDEFKALVKNLLINIPLEEGVFHKVIDETLVIAHPLIVLKDYN